MADLTLVSGCQRQFSHFNNWWRRVRKIASDFLILAGVVGKGPVVVWEPFCCSSPWETNWTVFRIYRKIKQLKEKGWEGTYQVSCLQSVNKVRFLFTNSLPALHGPSVPIVRLPSILSAPTFSVKMKSKPREARVSDVLGAFVYCFVHVAPVEFASQVNHERGESPWFAVLVAAYWVIIYWRKNIQSMHGVFMIKNRSQSDLRSCNTT